MALSPHFFASLFAFVLACGEPAGGGKTIDGGLGKKRQAAVRDRTASNQQIPENLQLRNLEIELFGGEFQKWSSAKEEGFIDTPGSKRLNWKNLRSDLTSATWRVHEGAPADKGGKLVAQGSISSVPAKNQANVFSIDFAKFLPAYPPTKNYDYYVQVVGKTSSDAEVGASNSLLVRYHKPSQGTNRFTDGSLELDVKGLNKDLYANSPMPVEIRLETLSVGRPNEDGADEPYLMVAAIAVDGTTINIFKLPSSTVRMFKSAGAHGNVPAVDQYGEVAIPATTGHFEFSIDPLGKDLLADLPDPNNKMGKIMREDTKIYLLIVAMEEDNATDAAANAAREAFFKQLQTELEAIIQSIQLSDLQADKEVEFDVGAISQRLQDAAIDAGLNKSLDPSNGWWTPVLMPITTLMQAADPDDYIGVTIVEFSFGELLDNWPNKVDFSMALTQGGNSDAYYTVEGFARRDVAK